MIALLLTACTFSVQLPDGPMNNIGKEALSIAHPMARFEHAAVVGANAGGCGTAGGDRFVDLAIAYSGGLAKGTHLMNVRLKLQSLDPCLVTTDVISDSGPVPPVLLDNWIASPVLGESVCAALGAK